jgi:hypothetical protein
MVEDNFAKLEAAEREGEQQEPTENPAPTARGEGITQRRTRFRRCARQWQPVITLFFDFFLVLFTAVLAVVSIHQGDIARKAVRRSTRAANAAERAAKAAEAGNASAVKQFISAERPWLSLGIIIVKNPLAHLVPMRISVQVTNSGRSPGLNVRAYGRLFPWSETLNFGHPLDTFPECFRPKPTWHDCIPPPLWTPTNMPPGGVWRDCMGGAIVLPGISQYIQYSWELQSPIMNDDAVERFKPIAPPVTAPTPTPTAQAPPSMTLAPSSRPSVLPMKEPDIDLNSYLIYVVCIDYFDEFEDAHRTVVCARYSPITTPSQPNGTFQLCDNGNTAD